MKNYVIGIAAVFFSLICPCPAIVMAFGLSIHIISDEVLAHVFNHHHIHVYP